MDESILSTRPKNTCFCLQFFFKTKIIFIKLFLIMSLSKELCLRSDSQNSHSLNERKENNYRSDSFEDRFCDDLCEDILQYLSLEDKFRLECVSKQFERTVFKRQYELFLNVWEKKVFLRNRIRSDYNKGCVEDQILDPFKALLKKCPNVETIKLDGPYYDNRNYTTDKINQVYRLIFENCNNLSEVIVLNQIDDSNFEEFHRKFGPKVKYFRYHGHLRDLNLFPNVEKIQISLEDDSIFAQLNLAKLKKLDLFLGHGQEHMVQTVIDNFPELTHLYIDFDCEDENAIYKPLKNISNLKHLIHFRFNNRSNKNKIICDLLKQMANNCQNLKSIDCRFDINDQNSDIKQLFSQFNTFSALKRLNLFLDLAADEEETDEEQEDIDVNQLFSFELFKGFENITHLTLYFNLSQTLKESILKEIDINLPKLQYLEISNIFDTTAKGVQQMADILSRLSRLETLIFWFKTGVYLKTIEKQITEKCRKIRKILIKTF